MSTAVAVAQALRALEHRELLCDPPCHWSGPLSLAEARLVMQVHRECTEGLGICRVRRTAVRMLADSGVFVPDSHRPNRLLSS